MTGVHKIEQFLINEGKDAFFLLITRYGRFHDIFKFATYSLLPNNSGKRKGIHKIHTPRDHIIQ